MNLFSGLATIGDFDYTGSYVAYGMVREKVVVRMGESITRARLRLYIVLISEKADKNSQKIGLN